MLILKLFSYFVKKTIDIPENPCIIDLSGLKVYLKLDVNSKDFKWKLLRGVNFNSLFKMF